MLGQINKTILAYLLALRDFPDILSEQEQQNLKKVAQDLKMQPKAWKSHIEPCLLETIKGNSQLDQAYQLYKEKLDILGEIPLNLLPKLNELNQLVTNESTFATKGGIPSAPSGYNKQLNNVIILVNQNDKPEEAVKKLEFLDRMKQWLGSDSQ